MILSKIRLYDLEGMNYLSLFTISSQFQVYCPQLHLNLRRRLCTPQQHFHATNNEKQSDMSQVSSRATNPSSDPTTRTRNSKRARGSRSHFLFSPFPATEMGVSSIRSQRFRTRVPGAGSSPSEWRRDETLRVLCCAFICFCSCN